MKIVAPSVLLLWPFLLLCFVLVQADDGDDDCHVDNFDIEVVLHGRNDTGYDFSDCSVDENLFIAEQIAADMNYVFVRTGLEFGVTNSQTRICKEGELVFVECEEDRPSRRRRIRHQRRQLSATMHQYVFRGTGSCRFCSNDDWDFRERRMADMDTRLSDEVKPSEASPSNPPASYRQMSQPINRRLEGTQVIVSQPIVGMNASMMHTMKHWAKHAEHSEEAKEEIVIFQKRYKKLMKKFVQRKKAVKKAEDEESRLKAIEKLAKLEEDFNNLGYIDYVGKYTEDYEVGFFKDDDGFHRYYYVYKKDEYDYNVLSDILAEILRLKFNLEPVNAELCTFGDISRVEVKLTETTDFEIPDC